MDKSILFEPRSTIKPLIFTLLTAVFTAGLMTNAFAVQTVNTESTNTGGTAGGSTIKYDKTTSITDIAQGDLDSDTSNKINDGAAAKTAVGMLTDGSTSGTINVNTATVGSDGLTVNGATTLNGNTDITGANTLSVGTGATTLGGTLEVTGKTTLNGGTTFTSGGNADQFNIKGSHVNINAGTGDITHVGGGPSTLLGTPYSNVDVRIDGRELSIGNQKIDIGSIRTASGGAPPERSTTNIIGQVLNVDTAAGIEVDNIAKLNGGIEVTNKFTVDGSSGNVGTSGTLTVNGNTKLGNGAGDTTEIKGDSFTSNADTNIIGDGTGDDKTDINSKNINIGNNDDTGGKVKSTTTVRGNLLRVTAGQRDSGAATDQPQVGLVVDNQAILNGGIFVKKTTGDITQEGESVFSVQSGGNVATKGTLLVEQTAIVHGNTTLNGKNNLIGNSVLSGSTNILNAETNTINGANTIINTTKTDINSETINIGDNDGSNNPINGALSGTNNIRGLNTNIQGNLTQTRGNTSLTTNDGNNSIKINDSSDTAADAAISIRSNDDVAINVGDFSNNNSARSRFLQTADNANLSVGTLGTALNINKNNATLTADTNAVIKTNNDQSVVTLNNEGNTSIYSAQDSTITSRNENSFVAGTNTGSNFTNSSITQTNLNTLISTNSKTNGNIATVTTSINLESNLAGTAGTATISAISAAVVRTENFAQDDDGLTTKGASLTVNSNGEAKLTSETKTTIEGGNTKLTLTESGRGLKGATFSDENGDPVQVDGVADGTDDFDAVNYRQLRRVNRGVAMSMAMAALPKIVNGKTTIAVGTAVFNGDNAYAIGISHHDTETNTVFNINGAKSGNEIGASVGAGWSF